MCIRDSFRSGANKRVKTKFSHSILNRTRSKARPLAASTVKAQIMVVSETNIPVSGMEDPAKIWNNRRQAGGGGLGKVLLSPPKTSMSRNLLIYSLAGISIKFYPAARRCDVVINKLLGANRVGTSKTRTVRLCYLPPAPAKS